MGKHFGTHDVPRFVLSTCANESTDLLPSFPNICFWWKNENLMFWKYFLFIYAFAAKSFHFISPRNFWETWLLEHECIGFGSVGSSVREHLASTKNNRYFVLSPGGEQGRARIAQGHALQNSSIAESFSACEIFWRTARNLWRPTVEEPECSYTKLRGRANITWRINQRVRKNGLSNDFWYLTWWKRNGNLWRTNSDQKNRLLALTSTGRVTKTYEEQTVGMVSKNL